jgi:hypothetical protein
MSVPKIIWRHIIEDNSIQGTLKRQKVLLKCWHLSTKLQNYITSHPRRQ